MPVADDPYAQFVAEQNTQECQWDANRAAKQAKIHTKAAAVVTLDFDPDVASDVANLRQQLEAKTGESAQEQVG